MGNSILNSVKKVLGLEPDYTAFDADVLMHINSVFMILNQLGVGPKTPLVIEDAEATWDEFDNGRMDISAVRTYVYLRVRLLFDPPTSSFVLSAMENQYKELEWRLNIQVEGGDEFDD